MLLDTEELSCNMRMKDDTYVSLNPLNDGCERIPVLVLTEIDRDRHIPDSVDVVLHFLSSEPEAEQESASMSATAVAMVDLVHPQGRKYNPLAAQQWADLNHTIKSALASTTDERIINAALGAKLTSRRSSAVLIGNMFTKSILYTDKGDFRVHQRHVSRHA